MNRATFDELIEAHIAGEISAAQLAQLERVLMKDARARALLRERMDLEAGLRTWAAETESLDALPTHVTQRGRRRQILAAVTVVAAAAAIVLAFINPWATPKGEEAPEIAPAKKVAVASEDAAPALVCTVRKQQDCIWQTPRTVVVGRRMTAGTLALASGVAEIQFGLGTTLVMEGPCEARVVAGDAAELITGNVVINVGGPSDRFTLKTPNAVVRNEGTEYGVSVDGTATEVHVFEGAVRWKPEPDKPANDRIEAGKARRYARSAMGRTGTWIPVDEAKFVRRIEPNTPRAAADLVARDGFESRARRAQRDGTSFGWAGGWRPTGRRRGRIGRIIDAPAGVAFGFRRTGRRVLDMSDGAAARRELARPLRVEPGTIYYLSVMIQCRSVDAGDRMLEIAVDDGRRRHRRDHGVAFGIAHDGLAFTKLDGETTRRACPLDAEAVNLLVAKIEGLDDGALRISMQGFDEGAVLAEPAPALWAVTAKTDALDFALSHVRLLVGTDASYDVDELRIGTTWSSVTVAPRGRR